ncbi:LPS-assembly protein [Arboricoccus pini]|uniref:LPS-assembly protein LptD n=1 Tax=Arboricoccus pini TaxID=1963835 RepID=A0A212Q7S5_9PROT|nr:LPS assembly protein LptD [Arboricoccus pini]SNB55425.1 LPS-assembly protein [Arboricoccus pini]
MKRRPSPSLALLVLGLASAFLPAAEALAQTLGSQGNSGNPSQPLPNSQDTSDGVSTDKPPLAMAPIGSGSKEPTVITADQLAFDQGADNLTATGHVELSQGDQRLRADKVVYDRRTDRAHAYGNVILLDPSGHTSFADEMEVTGDLKTGMAQGIRTLTQDQLRIAAVQGTRTDGTINTFDKVVYTPCPVCKQEGSQPLWQIKAQRAVWDETAREIVFRDARFEVLGIPVFYTPFFSQPDPTVTRKSGFLAPTGGTNSELGLTFETPYFVNLAPNRDITLTPMFTTSGGEALFVTGRDLENFGLTTLQASGAYTQKYAKTAQASKDDEFDFRGNISGTGRYKFSQDWVGGFDLNLSSDNTYLDRFNISSADILQNDVYVQRIVDQDFFGLSAYGFQSLREGEQQGTIPLVLPVIEYNTRSAPLRWGSTATYDANFVALTRDEGLDTRRISNTVGWELPWVDQIGGVGRLRLSGRADFYDYAGDPRNLTSTDNSNGTQARAFPKAFGTYSIPLIGETGSWQNFLEPVVAAQLAPYGLNSRRFPNEDSIEFEYDETNIFEENRFTGLDLVDDGTRVSYGLRFGSLGPGVVDIDGVIGQTYQPKVNDYFPSGSGLDTTFSDYVGRIDFRPTELLNFRYRFRLDKDNFKLRRSDIKVSFGPPRLRFDIGYLKLYDDAVDLTDDTREEITAGVRYQMTDRLAVASQFRRDLTSDSEVSNLFGLLYTHPCIQILAGLEQSFVQQGELKDEVSFKIRVSLATIGSVSSGY